MERIGDEVVSLKASTTFQPSHILQDGTFANLPESSKAEHIRFFERSIARHGLVKADLKTDEKDERTDESEKNEVDEDKKEIIEKPKIHPLALASARLQSSGINELNRAINLNNLTASGEYFGLTNIVESSTSDTNKHIQALFVLKRKRRAFQLASDALIRHSKRLSAALVVQSQPDQRLRSLRPNWRLVAPEHGTRALPHAARPTEIVAADIDVYLQTRTSFGRLAKGVPRYATVELAEKYCVKKHLSDWKNDEQNNESAHTNPPYSISAPPTEFSSTRAEAFAIADPTLGKIDADFDPNKVTMLTLQIDIEKPSTGFCQSHCLEPVSSHSTASSNEDEQLLVSLQHSLFCARLFESIRRELAPDTEHIGQLRTSAKVQTAVWLSGESDENCMPPESQLINNALCVVHVHEGDVKVLLDCEYSLRVRLVEPETRPDVNISCDSGSQSPEQLLTLCKILLVHGQERYHRHSVAATMKAADQEESRTMGDIKSPNKTNGYEDEPRILQNCVSLFTKLVFERRVRNVIQTVNTWIVEIVPKLDDRLHAQWLALSIFDMASHCTLTFRSWTCDATIVCDEMTVAQLCDDGSRRKVQFHSDQEFELFVKMAILKTINSTS